MTHSRFSRLAATGVATALTTAALVAGTTTIAGAETSGGATYQCPTGLPLPGLESLPIPVSVVTDVFDDAPLPAGIEASGVAPNVDILTSLPGGLLSTLQGLGVAAIGAQISDFALGLGEGNLPVSSITTPTTALPAPGSDLELASVGTLGDLVTPNAAGTYPISLPRQFTMVPVAQPALPIPLSLTCVLPDGVDAVIGEVEVRKQTSTIIGRTRETRQGHRAIARVSREFGGDVAGKVVAKLGKKRVAAKQVKPNGKATFALPKRAHGKKLTLVYRGDAGTEGSRTTVRVK